MNTDYILKENDLVSYSYRESVFLTRLFKTEEDDKLWAEDIARLTGTKAGAMSHKWEFNLVLTSAYSAIELIENYGQITVEEFKEKNPQYFI